MKTNSFFNSKHLIPFIALIFAAQSNFLFSQNKEQIYDELKSKLTGLKSISFDFSSTNGSEMAGKIIATKDKYKMILPNRVIVSNANTVWNYSPDQAKVLISTMGDVHSASIQGVFFQIIENYKPQSLKVATKSSGAKFYELSLKSNQNQDDYIILNLNYKTKNIEAVNYSLNGQSAQLFIKNLVFNPKISDTEFNFIPPKDVQVIDLR